jgi:predicted nucleic acid-binding protein
MTEKVFVDTNVLVYAYDRDSHQKQKTAEKLLRSLWPDRAGALSPQVLQEFYVTVTRKIRFPLGKDDARRLVNLYVPWSVEASVADIRTAFQIEDEGRISFWDALIVASAVRAGAGRLVTEDLRAGRIIAGVRIENPFAVTT